MLNQIILVGRLVSDLEIKETIEDRKEVTITLAIPRSFKNAEGEHETDFIQCVLWNGIAENTAEYCKKGDVIGVKGRVQSKSYLREDGTSYNVVELIAEKVTFLSSKSNDD